jgi:hypothetical protein
MDNGESTLERLMEVAQEQQLHESATDNNNELTQRGRSRDDEVLGHRVVRDLPEIDQEGGRQLHPLPANRFRLRRNIDRRYGGHVTNIYVALSVLMAYLALFTPPSSVEFSFIGSQTKSIKIGEIHQLKHVADKSTPYLADKMTFLDGHGNIENKILSNDEGWEVFVSHSNGKPESTKEISQSHHQLSWTSVLLNFLSELQDHITKQISILKLNYEAASIISRSESKSPSETAESAESKFPSMSAKWTFPWEWTQQGSTHKSDTLSDNSGQSDFYVYSTISNNSPESVQQTTLFSILTTKFVAAETFLRQLFLWPENGGVNNQLTLSSPPKPTILDKVITSAPRLVILANLLLVATYLLQIAVADFFLGPSTTANRVRNISAGQRHSSRIPNEASRRRRAGRERFWGFIIFKLLLVSVALDPAGIDLFILTSWYAFVSFLRSLSHLAGTTASHASQSGVAPSAGALHLLIIVLACDVLATIGCVSVFSDAGWNIIFLLTCDCIILGADVATHILRYELSVKEEAHRLQVSRLEERQLALRALRMERLVGASSSHHGGEIMSARSNLHGDEGEEVLGDDDDLAYEDELHHLDQMVQLYELAHASRQASIGTATFSFEIFSLCVSVMHLVHIWTLHGAAFRLVNAVLVLQMQSIVSLIGKKIAERRNALRVTREINSRFQEASDKDIRNALAAKDVCCICLNSLSFGSVKKVRCGHLFHNNCLREVIERERSFAATKCPLCRTSIVVDHRQAMQDGHSGVMTGPGNIVNNDASNDGGGARATMRQTERAQNVNSGEQSLLRISTEHIMPSWLPIPAFAFEVVRRDTTVIAEPNPPPEAGWQRFFRRGGQVQETNPNNNDNNQIQHPEVQQETSFWRRLFILLGVIPMSPEEEAVALDQLVDMFPQYDRADLLRELRARMSSEAVAESILLGIFSGVPRGG